ncbi:hypothetical protein [Actinoplanes sp. NPDC020271]|uniref:hypothetical protein n=1 Tax=Actinoplanes sp. NPDC020271 TaxID=3363896 RepID=UPI0037ACC3F1
MPSTPAPTGHYDGQDLINELLAAALHTRATIAGVLHATAVSRAVQPQAAAALTDAAAALTHIHDNLIRAAGPGENDRSGQTRNPG